MKEFKIKVVNNKNRSSQIELDNDWKDIPGFPHYKINKFGQVKRIDSIVIDKNGIAFNRKGRILSSRKTPSGYIQVDMCENGIPYGRLIHILLANVFIPNPNNYPIVNHIDENPSNNDLSNLEWCDYSHNALHSIKKIKEGHRKEQKAVIRINPKTNEETKYLGIREAARENNTHHSNIRYAILHNSYCKNYKWKYD